MDRLPEKNEQNIQSNREAILANRDFLKMTGLMILILSGVIIYLLSNQHDMESCQAKLYEHLTKQKAPSTFELKKVENPEIYKDLFEDCQ